MKAKTKTKVKAKKAKFELIYMICREEQFGKYVVADCGAIYKTLKEAQEHVLICDERSDLFIISCYRLGM